MIYLVLQVDLVAAEVIPGEVVEVVAGAEVRGQDVIDSKNMRLKIVEVVVAEAEVRVQDVLNLKNAGVEEGDQDAPIHMKMMKRNVKTLKRNVEMLKRHVEMLKLEVIAGAEVRSQGVLNLKKMKLKMKTLKMMKRNLQMPMIKRNLKMLMMKKNRRNQFLYQHQSLSDKNLNPLLLPREPSKPRKQSAEHL